MKTKIFSVLLLTVLLICMLSVFVHAEEPEPEPINEDAWMQEAVSRFNALNNVDVTYTSDCDYEGGVVCVLYVDELNKSYGFTIETELPFGYEIYNDPETDYIDGIRVNGKTVTSTKVDATADPADTAYSVLVRVVYKDDASGNVARIFAGEFDWLTFIFTNPVTLAAVLYYAVATIAVIVSIFAAGRAKRKGEIATLKQVKEMRDDITKLSADQRDAIVNNITEALVGTLKPLVTSVGTNSQNLAKAFVLSKSTASQDQLAVLDVLKEIGTGSDLAGILDTAREKLINELEKATEHKESIIETLTDIATSNQEALNNATEEDTPSIF